MGCGDSTKFPCLFQVFIWPRGSSAGLRQKHIPTPVKPWRDGAQLFVWGLLLLQSPLLKVRERNSCCSKASKITINLVFFKTVASVWFDSHYIFIHYPELLEMASLTFTLEQRSVYRHLKKGLISSISLEHGDALSLCPAVQAGQTTLFQAFAWAQAAEAQRAVTVLLVMWDSPGWLWLWL